MIKKTYIHRLGGRRSREGRPQQVDNRRARGGYVSVTGGFVSVGFRGRGSGRDGSVPARLFARRTLQREMSVIYIRPIYIRPSYKGVLGLFILRLDVKSRPIYIRR